MTTEQDDAAFGEKAEALTDRITPLLVGQPPDTVGAALASCVSLWLASHHPDGRAAAYAVYSELVERLNVINYELIAPHWAELDAAPRRRLS